MEMKCTACLKNIEKSKGYYLVTGAPYCVSCYQVPGDIPDIRPLFQWRRKPENLLEEFRAYQKCGHVSAFQSF